MMKEALWMGWMEGWLLLVIGLLRAKTIVLIFREMQVDVD